MAMAPLVPVAPLRHLARITMLMVVVMMPVMAMSFMGMCQDLSRQDRGTSQQGERHPYQSPRFFVHGYSPVQLGGGPLPSPLGSILAHHS